MPDKKIFTYTWLLIFCVLFPSLCISEGSGSTSLLSASKTNLNHTPNYTLSYQFPVADSTRFPEIRDSNQWQVSESGWIREHLFSNGFWFGELPKVAWLKVSFVEPNNDRTAPLWLELASSGVSRATLYYQLPNGIWRSINSDAVYQPNSQYAPTNPWRSPNIA